MKILFVVSGTKRVAASRYRVYQYLAHLDRNGIRYAVFSNIGDFATRLAIRSPEFGEIARMAYYILIFFERFTRFWAIFFRAPSFDLVFLQRATFPFGLEKLLRLANANIVFDIDDAIFLPDTPRHDLTTRLKAFIKEGELKAILRITRCVIVENDYIKEYVSKFCNNVHKIPGPIDTERYFVRPKDNSGEHQGIVLGWIGSPATTAYLHLLDNVFRQILSRFKNTKIVLIGAGNYNFPDERVMKKTWRYDTEIDQLQAFDIGLMPMPNDQWTKGKLGCKMLQYMAVGAASIVSYTPTNAEVIIDGKNGFLVNTEFDWIETLSRLIEDGALRASVGREGRKTVEELCSVTRNAPRLIEALKSLRS